MLISPFFILKLIKELDRDERLTLESGDRGKIFYNTLVTIRNLRVNMEFTKGKNDFLYSVYKRVIDAYYAQEIESINSHLINETDNRKADRSVAVIIEAFKANDKYASDFLDKKKDIISLKFSQQTEEKVIISRTKGFYKVEYIRESGKSIERKYDIEDEIEDIREQIISIITKLNLQRKGKAGKKQFNPEEYANYKLDLKTDSYFGESEEFEDVVIKKDLYIHNQILAFNLYKSLIRTRNMQRGVDSFVKLYGKTQEARMLEEFLR